MLMALSLHYIFVLSSSAVVQEFGIPGICFSSHPEHLAEMYATKLGSSSGAD
jgi:hypothetical protein